MRCIFQITRGPPVEALWASRICGSAASLPPPGRLTSNSSSASMARWVASSCYWFALAVHYLGILLIVPYVGSGHSRMISFMKFTLKLFMIWKLQSLCNISIKFLLLSCSASSALLVDSENDCTWNRFVEHESALGPWRYEEMKHEGYFVVFQLNVAVHLTLLCQQVFFMELLQQGGNREVPHVISGFVEILWNNTQ